MGVVCGLLVWGSLSVVGLSAVLAASPRAYLLVRVLGGGYLIFLGAQAFRSGRADGPTVTTAPMQGRPFFVGLATNLLNPKIAVFYTALMPTLAPPSSGAWGLGAVVLMHAAMTLAWLSGYAYALDRARALFQRPVVRRTLDRFTGIVLFAFAMRLVTGQP